MACPARLMILRRVIYCVWVAFCLAQDIVIATVCCSCLLVCFWRVCRVSCRYTALPSCTAARSYSQNRALPQHYGGILARKSLLLRAPCLPGLALAATIHPHASFSVSLGDGDKKPISTRFNADCASYFLFLRVSFPSLIAPLLTCPYIALLRANARMLLLRPNNNPRAG